MSERIGTVKWINGPVIRAEGSRHVGMMELVEVGEEHLIGEVIGLNGNIITIQVYEETSGMHPGAPVFGTGLPLSVELGPGLLRSIFDGIQRPLPVIEMRTGSFISRGVHLTPLYRKDRWEFTPVMKEGTVVTGGEVIGTVPETPSIEHRVMIPPDISGTVIWVAPAKSYTIVEPIARVKTDDGEKELTMLQRWPIRRLRPYKTRLDQSIPLITGQRVLDTFFPLGKGGAAAIPGGFGAGKTVTQHSIAKYADAQVVIYIGCGERGNEMTEVLQEFPELIDPRSGHPLMERTVLIANTSNMPVAAREASVYTGITIAEYYRDMGYHVALMADSTSRWAEALREVSGRLEEMPAEEGYPAYLAARLAEFYERAGYVRTLSGEDGSVSIIGAVSPPGGDFSEPVTQHTKRFIRCFWALDKSLASARHFPSINWLDSYSEYLDDVAPWWHKATDQNWIGMRNKAMELLSEESRLSQIVKLVGPDALPDEQRLVLETSRLLREGFLQQNAMDTIDAYSTVQKQIGMLALMLYFHDRAHDIIKMGATISVIHKLPVVDTLIRMKTQIPNDKLSMIDEIHEAINAQMTQLEADYK
ncbi:MAG: V-type ATP synthase subunit A [Chloroflexi bacterium HGW-Chloroflexi-5]|jgi:V/A-type H+-transporting ATPase subunit A|nr:MAG: V-type ATP synthase subunit A [Chloroflexi bacterium HGW-Chloroflexi-5]